MLIGRYSLNIRTFAIRVCLGLHAAPSAAQAPVRRAYHFCMRFYALLLLVLLGPSSPAQTGAHRGATGALLEVHSLEGEPVADAEVHFLAGLPPVSEDLASLLDIPPHPAAFVAEHGKRLKTDAKGRVRLPEFTGRAGIVVRHGDAWGAKQLENPVHPHLLLRLRQRRDVKVQVRGPDGRPRPGALVRLFIPHNLGGSPVWEGKTVGPRGLVVVPNPAVITDYQDVIVRIGAVAFWTACSRGPIEPSDFQKFDPLHPPRDPITLTMPDTGTLRVKLKDHEGKPAAEDVFVTAFGHPEGQPRGPRRDNLYAFLLPNAVKKRIVDGEAIIPYVAVGGNVHVQVWGRGWREHLVDEVVKAPEKAGEVIETVLRLPEAHLPLVVTARIVDDKGKPVASTRIDVMAVIDNHPTLEGHALASETDAHGRLRVEVGADSELWDRLRLGVLGPKTGDWKASMPILLKWKKRVHDLGDVPIRAREPWLSGTVADAAGRPVAHAEVFVGHERLRKMKEGDPGRPLPRMGSEHGQKGWWVSTDAEGRWALLGPPMEGPFFITASRRGYDKAVLEVDPVKSGKRTFDLVMRRVWTAHLRIQPQPGFDPTQLSVRVSGPATLGESVPYNFPDVDGWVQLDHLRPGKLRAEVHMRGREAPLKVIEHVIEATPTVTSHLFLPAVDVAKLFSVRTITVKHPDGVPAREVTLLYRMGGRGDFSVGERSRDGRVEILTDGSPIDLILLAPGCRVARFRGIEKDRTVTMHRGYEIRLRMKSAKKPPKGLHLGVRLHAPKPDEEWGPHGREQYQVEFEKTQEAVLYVHAPGRYRVEGELWGETFGFPYEIDVGEVKLEVRASDEPQTFTINVTEKALQQAVERIR